MLLSSNSQKARAGVLPALLVGVLCLFAAAPVPAQQTTPTEVTLTASDLTPTEGETVTLTATLDEAAPTDGVTLTLKVLDKVSETIYTSATATDDYTLSPSTISIAEGGQSGTATLSIVDDSEVEDNWYSIAGETVVLSVSSTTPALASKPLIVTIIDNDGPFAGRRPSQPTLEAITSGTNAPTATTLSFNVGCVSGGGSPITDYVLWAENVDDPSDYYDQTFAAPDETCVTIVRTMTVLPRRTSATTYRVRAYARSLLGFRSPWSDPVEATTSAQQASKLVAGALPAGLSTPFPTPFNAEVILPLALAEADWVRLSVYNLLGQPVRVLADGWLAAGAHRVRWDGRTDGGAEASSGVYLVVLQTGATVQTAKLALIR